MTLNIHLTSTGSPPLILDPDSPTGQWDSAHAVCAMIRSNPVIPFGKTFATLMPMNDILSNNPKSMLQIIQLDASFVSKIGTVLQNNSEFMLKAIQINPTAVEYLGQNLRNDPAFMLKASLFRAFRRNITPIRTLHSFLLKQALEGASEDQQKAAQNLLKHPILIRALQTNQRIQLNPAQGRSFFKITAYTN